MPKSFTSRFKTYTYNTCDDLKHLSGREIIRINPSTVNWDIMNSMSSCKPEQRYALGFLMDLKELKKTTTPNEYNTEVKDAIKMFEETLKNASPENFKKTAQEVLKTLKSRSGKGVRSTKRRRSTKKRRKLSK